MNIVGPANQMQNASDSSGSGHASSRASGHTASHTASHISSDETAGKGKSTGAFFTGAPLSGQVSVIDHAKQGGTRLKRSAIPVDSNGPSGNGGGSANSHELPLGGFLEEGAAKTSISLSLTRQYTFGRPCFDR
jgi:hypothetical protein